MTISDRKTGKNLTAWLETRRHVAVRRLRAAWERFWFHAFKTRVAVANVMLGLVAWLGDLVDPFGDLLPDTLAWKTVGWCFKGAGFVLALVGAIGVVGLAWRRLRPREAYELRPADPELGLGLQGFADVSDPVVIARGANGSVALNGAVGFNLERARHDIVLVAQPYAWPEELLQASRLAHRAMNPLAVNELKLGLRTEIDRAFIESASPAFLQRTSYFFDRTTNDVLGKTVFACGKNRPVWWGRDHFISEENYLIRLDRAPASNQLGGSTILIDQSRNVYLTRQTSTSAESAGLLAPTGSGSFDLSSYQTRVAKRPNLSFQEFCRGEIERELFEETDLNFGDLDLRTFLIGFGRYLYRGGKPEVFAVSGLRRTAVEMKVSARERLWTAGHVVIPLDDLSSLNEECLAEFSAPLAANAAALRMFLSSADAGVLWSFLDD